MHMQALTPDSSLVNSVLDARHENSPNPTVGMGATVLGWTDRYAGTVIDVSGNRITIQEDHSERTDSNGDTANQVYAYSKNDKGMLHHFSKRGGKWVQVVEDQHGSSWRRKEGGYELALGERDHFYDFSY